jgi:hypothetical protein
MLVYKLRATAAQTAKRIFIFIYLYLYLWQNSVSRSCTLSADRERNKHAQVYEKKDRENTEVVHVATGGC